MHNRETRTAKAHPSNNGPTADDACEASKPNATEVKNARDTPAKTAVIPTNTAIPRGKSLNSGSQCRPRATKPPTTPPSVMIGATVPPDVPLPRHNAHERNLKTPSVRSATNASLPSSIERKLS